ncbi:hypothetical protein [Pontiella sulfatireligans]|uniref:Uncharacterized protein n=1 Tax=Pontiella sulfatireligans TaxID=2750658 RepID=A0A6C2UGX2_9BACT|nr:hypothetical protein [Pontiella sulfatireligans]VGO19103.1 hypothetical protein SCARR_01159 [Pontiella sulfatireligans]
MPDNRQAADSARGLLKSAVPDGCSLTYTVELDGNLVSAPVWATTGVEFVGESASVNNYKSMTNRTDISSQEFVKLTVVKLADEKN